jgi:hypothetical protein
MAQFNVLETSFINNTLVEPGDVVELADGIEPGPNLEAVKAPKKGTTTADAPETLA